MNVDLSGLAAIGALLTTGGIGVWVNKLRGDKPTIGSREIGLVNELQEEVASLRAEVRTLRDEVREWAAREDQLVQHIYVLNEHITAGTPPPPPPIPLWKRGSP